MLVKAAVNPLQGLLVQNPNFVPTRFPWSWSQSLASAPSLMEVMALEDPCIFTACKEDSHLVRPSSSSGSLHLLGGKATLNMQTLLSQLLRFDILVTRIVSSVLTARSRQFYWRNTKARRQPSAASNHHVPCRAGSAWLGDMRGGHGGRGGNNLKHLYHEIWQKMLLGTYICLGVW